MPRCGLYGNLVPGSGGGSEPVSPEQIEAAVNKYLTENPVQAGATAEQAAQIEKNSSDISDVYGMFTQVTGKNLYDASTANPVDGKMMNDSGVIVDAQYYAWTGYIPCDSEETYIFSANDVLIHIACFFKNDKTIIERKTISNASFTTPLETAFVGFNIFAKTHTKEDFDNAIGKAQLEKGTVSTPYEPYINRKELNLENLESGGELSKIIEIPSEKSIYNIYDKAIAKDGMYFSSRSEVTEIGTAIFSGKIPVDPNAQYCISVSEEYEGKISPALYFFDRYGGYIRNNTNFQNTISLPFNTDIDVYYVAFNAYLNQEHTEEEFKNFIGSVMLEPGSCRGKSYYQYNVESVIPYKKIYDSPILEMFDLSEKRWLSVGTSITWYNSNKYQSGINTGKLCRGYQYYVCKYTGIILDNIGISGSTLSNVNSNSFINRYADIDYEKYDVISIEYGVNDYGNNVELNTFISDYKTVVEHIITNYPKIKLIICTDPDVRGENTNDNGNTLKEFSDATIEIARQYRLPLCDWYYSIGISDFTRGDSTKDYLTADGTHPNDDGHERMGRKLLYEMVFV